MKPGAHVRGHENALKRLLIHAGAFNLGLWMRTLFGIGTPRALQGRLAAFGALLSALPTLMDDAKTATCSKVGTRACCSKTGQCSDRSAITSPQPGAGGG